MTLSCYGSLSLELTSQPCFVKISRQHIHHQCSLRGVVSSSALVSNWENLFYQEAGTFSIYKNGGQFGEEALISQRSRFITMDPCHRIFRLLFSTLFTERSRYCSQHASFVWDTGIITLSFNLCWCSNPLHRGINPSLKTFAQGFECHTCFCVQYCATSSSLPPMSDVSHWWGPRLCAFYQGLPPPPSSVMLSVGSRYSGVMSTEEGEGFMLDCCLIGNMQ